MGCLRLDRFWQPTALRNDLPASPRRHPMRLTPPEPDIGYNNASKNSKGAEKWMTQELCQQ